MLCGNVSVEDLRQVRECGAPQAADEAWPGAIGGDGEHHHAANG